MIIFCFDLMVLKRKVTSQGFIYHDSLLVSDVDARQKEILFNIIKEEIGDLQYIININEDQIESFNEITKKYIYDNLSLELSDESAKTKLLGIEVEFKQKESGE